MMSHDLLVQMAYQNKGDKHGLQMTDLKNQACIERCRNGDNVSSKNTACVILLVDVLSCRHYANVIVAAFYGFPLLPSNACCVFDAPAMLSTGLEKYHLLVHNKQNIVLGKFF